MGAEPSKENHVPKEGEDDPKNVPKEGENDPTKFEEVIIHTPLQEKQQTKDTTRVVCDKCMKKINTTQNARGISLCFTCKLYVCENCVSDHKSHKCATAENRDELNVLFEAMIYEKDRQEKLFENDGFLCNRVLVKHDIDYRPCSITSICVLGDEHWVVCDEANSCIKVFQSDSSELHRYVLLDPKPFDVKEVKLKLDPLEDGLSILLLWITMPTRSRILILDLRQVPATKNQVISFTKHCYRIHYSDGVIYAHCKQNRSGKGGGQLRVLHRTGCSYERFPTDAHYTSDLEIGNKGTIYLADKTRDQVEIVRSVGREKKVRLPNPTGIATQPDGSVYVSGQNPDNIYRLSSNLNDCRAIFDQKSVPVEKPEKLCFHGNKLLVSHSTSSRYRNYISVIKLY